MTPQSSSEWDLTQFSQHLFHCSKHTAKSFLGIAFSCLIVFSWISLTVWNLFPFKGDFSLGKNQKSQGSKSGLQRGWVTWMIWCFTKKLCMRHDAWVGMLPWWSYQSPLAYSCSHFHRIVSLNQQKKIEVVLLIHCLAWRSILMMDNTFPIKKHS